MFHGLLPGCNPSQTAEARGVLKKASAISTTSRDTRPSAISADPPIYDRPRSRAAASIFQTVSTLPYTADRTPKLPPEFFSATPQVAHLLFYDARPASHRRACRGGFAVPITNTRISNDK